jgi:dTDP-4-dehydrorhamnose 3,5-epimerase
MIFTETKLQGAFVIELVRQEDEEGFSAVSFSQSAFEANGLEAAIVQANASYSKKRGTMRGLHLQVDPFEETKCIRCTKGAIWDVIVDLRAGSSTYGEWVGVALTEHNYRMVYVPKGFAHGYLTLEDHSIAAYHATQFYTAGSEIGIRWNDPCFGIQWPIQPLYISGKDRAHPDFLAQQAVGLG